MKIPNFYWQDGDNYLIEDSGGVLVLNLLWNYWNYIPKDCWSILKQSNMLNFFYGLSFSFWQISLNAINYLLLKIILFLFQFIFSQFWFLSFFMYSFLWLLYFILFAKRKPHVTQKLKIILIKNEAHSYCCQPARVIIINAKTNLVQLINLTT